MRRELKGDVVMHCCQSTLSTQSQTMATLTSKLSLRESNCERQSHDLQQMKERHQELTVSVRELARRAATSSTTLPGLHATVKRSAFHCMLAFVPEFRF